MRRSKAAIALVAGTLLLAFVVPGGAAAAGGTGGTLEGPTWVLASYAVNGTMTTVPSAVYVDASFKSGTVNGFGGCNAYSGSYSASGSSLTFGQLASTLMLCAGPAGHGRDQHRAHVQPGNGIIAAARQRPALVGCAEVQGHAEQHRKRAQGEAHGHPGPLQGRDG